MKIDLNDPRITAFALGELKGDDAIELARAVRTDARVRAAVDEVRETSGLLMATLGGNETHLLTPEQRDAVRRVGSAPVGAGRSSSTVPFWKNPALAGIGVAAAVALVLYMVTGRPGGAGNGNGEDGHQASWDWAQVELKSLMLPAVYDSPVLSGEPNGPSNESVHAVSAAMSRDTTNFRKELKRRIAKMEVGAIASGSNLPELEETSRQRWQMITKDQVLSVPLVSGGTSWPWIERSIREKKLPPRRAVRIEEMVNHFRYKKPSMVGSGGLAGDLEICETPWNASTVLLAVHVRADLAYGENVTTAELTLNAERVRRVRLIGYTQLKGDSSSVGGTGFSQASRSHGNYVMYELELADHGVSTEKETAAGAVAVLSLGKGADKVQLPVGRVSRWNQASSDLRFASAVSACGMLLGGSHSMGDLDPGKLVALVDLVEKQDSNVLGGDRREALKLLKESAALVDALNGQ